VNNENKHFCQGEGCQNTASVAGFCQLCFLDVEPTASLYFKEGLPYKKNQEQKKLRAKFRHQFKSFFSGSKSRKGEMERYVGCSLQFLHGWLTAQFNQGMSWDNYGAFWVVDHLEPLSIFDLSNEEQRKIAFHYTNLQPLTVHENSVKGPKEAYRINNTGSGYGKSYKLKHFKDPYEKG